MMTVIMSDDDSDDDGSDNKNDNENNDNNKNNNENDNNNNNNNNKNYEINQMIIIIMKLYNMQLQHFTFKLESFLFIRTCALR